MGWGKKISSYIPENTVLIGRNPNTKFGIDQVIQKGSKDIERTTLGLQTD